jgi:trehalose-6-phosphate hydrolase
MNSQKEFAYQIFPKTFADGNQTGEGTLKGIINKMDYLQELGITKLWISPFFVTEFKDSGYDVVDYYNIDPSFGTMADFDLLVQEAKKRKIGLVADMVFNHTSDKHE